MCRVIRSLGRLTRLVRTPVESALLSHAFSAPPPAQRRERSLFGAHRTVLLADRRRDIEAPIREAE